MSSSDLAIIVDKVSKVYRIANASSSQSGGWLKRGGRVTEFWALRDVSLEIKRGSIFGFIGKNGAGKSTLLKILSRITGPTSGRMVLNGRVGSLLEVGTGFHPELTGRENIYLNGTILGMNRAEIDQAFDSIVDFAGYSEFLDTPVKRYSSGMYMRLAFAVAAHLRSEILLIDEVLAVGDAEFQSKCLTKVGEAAASGRTVIIVSHNADVTRQVCSEAALLRDGRVVHQGTAAECYALYSDRLVGVHQESWQCPGRPKSPLGLTAVDVRLHGSQPDLELDIVAQLKSSDSHLPATVHLGLAHYENGKVYQFAHVPFEDHLVESRNGSHAVKFHMTLPPLIPGTYFVNLWVGRDRVDWEQYDVLNDTLGFTVTESPSGSLRKHHASNGLMVPQTRFKYEPLSAEAALDNPVVR